MKHLIKLTLAFVIACGAPSWLSAQELRVGGGYSGSNIRESGAEKWVGRAGYQFGVDVLIGERLFVKPGLHLQVRNLRYTVLGVGQDGLPNGSASEYKYTSQALRIPVLAGVRLLAPPDGNGFNAYIMGGPTALVALKAKSDNNTLNVTTRSTQWYLGAGLGFEYRFLFLEGGYDVAMTNVFKGDGINTNPKVNNLYVATGLRFGLKK